jgi:hypothetical protein
VRNTFFDSIASHVTNEALFMLCSASFSANTTSKAFANCSELWPVLCASIACHLWCNAAAPALAARRMLELCSDRKLDAFGNPLLYIACSSPLDFCGLAE